MSSPRTSADGFNLFSNRTTPASSSSADGQSKSIIDGAWINTLQKKIDLSYPDQEYPKEDIAWAYVSNKERNATYQRHNPFSLRLSYYLEGYENLYDHTIIRREESYSSMSEYTINRTTAAVTYLNFLKQYNLAYITFLRAINGSEQATAQLKELFTTQKMFERARVKPKVLNKSVKNPLFLFGLLAYLTLDIVFSKESNISTAARIRALELIKQQFDSEKIAEAFNEFILGYYPYDVKEEPVYDMIPKRFVVNSNEAGGTPHNDLFQENTKIREIFPFIGVRFHETLDLDHGIAILLNRYPGEMLQVLQSFLKCNDHGARVDKKYIFIALVSLTKLDGMQKGQIFGANASFRNNGESKVGSLESRVGWVIGSENFGDFVSEDELNNLSNEELKMRVRQSSYRIHQLESELVDMGRESVMRETNSTNDPKGYFALLLLHPNTPEENFEELLRRNYRVLALKCHPDKPNGSEAKFKELKDAYDFLLNPENRKKYRAAAAGQGNTYRKT